MAEREFDAESVDRAFAEMVSAYHLTSDRPDPLATADHASTEATAAGADLGATDLGLAEVDTSERFVLDEPPRVVPPAYEPGPTTWRVSSSWADNHPLFADPTPTGESAPKYVPDPMPPLARPGRVALVGWIGIAFAAMVVLAAGFGLVLPSWVGWLAVGCFITGFGVLLTQLPRHRPPGSGDGAVL